MNTRSMMCAASLAAMLCAAGTTLAQASFGPAGYSENFDSMGTGTARPTGWSHWFILGTNDTYNAATTPAAMATTLPSFSARNVPLATYTQAGTTNPPNNQNATTGTTYGFNATFSSNTANRVLGAAAATGVGGSAMQLVLTNNTAAALSTLDLAYNFVALSRGTPQGGTAGTFPIGTETEIPGFRVFYSLSGNAGPWTNIADLNFNPPANSAIGFTQVVTASAVSIGAWNPGAQLTLRWVKDNEDRSSPDPLYGIDNVSIIPAPGAAALLALGLTGAARRRR